MFMYLSNNTKIDNMKVIAKGIINKNIADVWNVMGSQFAEVHLWSSNFNNSKPGGAIKFKGLEYSKRITLTERGETIQELDEFDASNHTLSYHITKGIPEVAEVANGKWFLIKQDEKSTQVVFEFMMEPKAFVKSEMITKIEKGLSHSAECFVEELKHYLETGKAHSRNKEQINNAIK